MECRVSVRIARFPICIVLALMAQPSWAEREVVLVAHRDSPIESISSLDLRKVYLGIVVEVAGKGIRAVRRRDDNRINQIFLQVCHCHVRNGRTKGGYCL